MRPCDDDPKIFGLWSPETLEDGLGHLWNDVCKPLAIVTIIVVIAFLIFYVFWFVTGGPICGMNGIQCG